MRTLIPGKVILTGEYGALFGASTVVIALNPSHECQDLGAGKTSVLSGLGPGFGSSTCHFWVRHQRALPLTVKDVKELRQIFKDECAPDQVRPSGVDIVAQLLGGSVLVVGDEISPFSMPVAVLSELWIARPKNLKKVDTQKALSSHAAKALVSSEDFGSLRKKWREACLEFVGLIDSLDWKSLAVCQAQIENLAVEAEVIGPEVLSLLKRTRMTSGVEFIKGCGALFQDVFLMNATARARTELASEFEFIGRLSDHFSKDGIRIA